MYFMLSVFQRHQRKPNGGSEPLTMPFEFGCVQKTMPNTGIRAPLSVH